MGQKIKHFKTLDLETEEQSKWNKEELSLKHEESCTRQEKQNMIMNQDKNMSQT